MRLLVASVFSRGSRNPLWLRLQLHYLARTLPGEHRFVQLVNNCDPADFPSVVFATDNDLQDNDARAVLLGQALNFFRACPEFENYLLLDSDAFPFRSAWLNRLLLAMDEDGGQPRREVAGMFRLENLETFLSPSVLFIRGDYLRALADVHDRLDFRPRLFTSLAGRGSMECGPAAMRGQSRLVLPLVRTNRFNRHPVLGGIYGGLFYHHGCGTRTTGLAAMDLGLYRASSGSFQTTDADQNLSRGLAVDADYVLRGLSGIEGAL